MFDVEVIDDPAAAAVALEPIRTRILAELAEPRSAAGLANRLGVPRQTVNYHLRSLETHGLVKEADQRKWGGITERRMVATSASYVVSPAAFGSLGTSPRHAADRLSASYLIALAARAIREVGALLRGARQAGQHLATLSIDTEIRFRSAADRAAFTADLTQAITKLVERHHDDSATDGRWHRLVVVAHPLPKESAHAGAH
jgi:DNA-binding transcriptional ArsR family regulator